MSESPADDSARITTPSDPPDPELVRNVRAHAAGRLVFGRFRLLKELGAGGMAVVWLAQDERLGIEVALKFLPGTVASDPEAVHDLRREITRGLELTHPAIVRLFDFHEDSSEGLAAIAMEYVAGSTLAEEKARQPDRCFDVAEPLISWTRTACEVLSYVHEEARVVHRDLKPRNLMLTRNGKLKVADFGIAATLCDSHSRLTQHPGSSGTPVYMSPQQAMGNLPTAADDIYGFGATLYELLTSKPPFFRGNMGMILNQVATVVPPDIEERRREFGIVNRPPVDPVWEATIMACLAKEPSARPCSMREVADRLGLNAAGPRAGPTPQHGYSVLESTAVLDSSDAETVADAQGGLGRHAFAPSPAQEAAGKGKSDRRWWLLGLVVPGALLAWVLVYHFSGRNRADVSPALPEPAVTEQTPATPAPPFPQPATPPQIVTATPGMITRGTAITAPVVIYAPPAGPASPHISEAERRALRTKRSHVQLEMTGKGTLTEMADQQVQRLAKLAKTKAVSGEERELARIVRARTRLSDLDVEARSANLDQQVAAQDRTTLRQLQALETWLQARFYVVLRKLLAQEAEVEARKATASAQGKSLSPQETERLQSAVSDARHELAQAEARQQKAEAALAEAGAKAPAISPFDEVLDELAAQE